MAYRIRDWDHNFETAESRKLKHLKWVALPNSQETKEYGRIAAHDRAVEIMAALPLIIQVASKAPTRGDLADKEGPLNPSDLSAITRYPKEIFEIAFEVLGQPGIGFIEEIPNTPGESPEARRNLPEVQQTPGAHIQVQGQVQRQGHKHLDPPTGGNGEGFSNEKDKSLKRPPRKRLTMAQKKRQKVNVNSALMVRIGAWFGRGPNTLWSLYEKEALDELGQMDNEEIEVMESYYTAEIREDDIRRTTVEILLNNWPGELDRARNYRPAKGYQEIDYSKAEKL